MLNIGDGDDALARPVEDALPGLMEGLELGSDHAGAFGARMEGTSSIDDRETKRTRR
jgi:hypothetical protein